MMLKLGGALLAIVVLTTACGSPDDAGDRVASLDAVTAEPDSDAGEPDTVGVVDDEQALLDFSACMRDQGVDFGDPTVDADGNVRLNPGGQPGAGIDRDSVDGAFQICGGYLDGVTLGFRDTDFTELQDQLLQYSVCMRDNGYDMPDPDFSRLGQPGDGPGDGPGGGGGIFGGLDFDDPAFQAAQQACQDILAGFGPGGTGPGRGGRG